MLLKKRIVAGLFAVMFLCVGRLMAVDDTDRLLSDDFMYSTPLTAEESLIDFAGAKGKDILNLPFATHPEQNRTSRDYNLELDASTIVKFMVDIENLNPEVPYSTPIFYLRSGDGWYSLAGKLLPMSKPNISRYEFEPARMRSEGKPTGLKSIDGFRVAIYNNDKKTDSKVRMISIAVQKPSILFVVEPGDDGKVDPYSENLIKILKPRRIASAVITQSELNADILKAAPIVMVPYQEKLSAESIDLLLNYAKGGGFLITSYTMPAELMQRMGFAKGKYVRAKKSGDDFAKMVFDPNLVKYFEGLLPESLQQASHNIISALPLDADQITDPFLAKEENRPRVAAWWYDENGDKTKHAAILQSGYGLFLSHVLYASPATEKGSFLLSFCLLHDESLRKELLLEQWRDIFSIGMRLKDNPRAKRAEILPDVLTRLDKKGWSRQQITTLLQGQFPSDGFREYSRFLADLNEVRADMIAVVCRSFRGKKVEGRFWWEHSGTGAYPGDWDRTCKELAEANFNGIIVNMLWGGSAHYKSDYLPPHRMYIQYGDQVAQACAACKKYGLELHIWKVNFNMLNSPAEFIEHMRREGRTQVTLSGEDRDWLCPSHPENQKLEINVMLEVATKYPVTGIHFDYIRYNGKELCFCDGCKARFGKYYFEKTGKKIVDLIKEYRKDDNIRTEFAQWKSEQITAIVRGVRERINRQSPQTKVSAAVFRDYPRCCDTVSQDWMKWIHAGYLDFVCPMNYTTDLAVFDQWVRDQVKYINGKIPLYPGIGLYSSSSRLRPDQTAIQIDMTRKLGAQGYTIFSLNRTTLNDVKDLLKQGPNQNQATLPHNKK